VLLIDCFPVRVSAIGSRLDAPPTPEAVDILLETAEGRVTLRMSYDALGKLCAMLDPWARALEGG
jgi:YD repeat-containing protein